MKRSTIVGVAVAAAFVLCAVAVAGASGAEPAYLACGKAAKSGKTYTGRYNNKTCSELSAGSDGKYELTAPKFPAKVKGTIGKVDIYLYAPMTKKLEGHFECTGGKESGALTSSREGTLAVSYSGCKATGSLAGPCGSPGKKSGEVVSEALASRLIWLNEGETEAGIELQAAATGGDLTKVVCAGGAETAELLGTMIADVAPTVGTSKDETIAFTANPSTGVP
jgi:hypothetical protein